MLPSQRLVELSIPEPIASWMALMVTMSFLPSARAISGVVTIAAAAPSLTPQQSKRPNGSAIIGALRICSMLTRLRICALGLSMPFSWLFQETCASARLRSSFDVPCLER
ncbi:hypothetical protein D3C84_914400 [compost metagenome]